MKKDIYDLLNQVKTDLTVYPIKKMEENEIKESTDRILNKLHAEGADAGVYGDKKVRTKKRKRFSMKKNLRAAAILAAALLSVGSVAYAATDGELFQYMYTFLSGGGIYETTDRSILREESTVTVVMGEADSVDKNGNTQVSVPFLFQDGRLYFTGDGNKTDITDKISEEKPYCIDVLDEMGNMHKFIIGGRAEAGCYGYQEILIDEQGKIRGGVGSYGAKVADDAPWKQRMDEEIMDLYKLYRE